MTGVKPDAARDPFKPDPSPDQFRRQLRDIELLFTSRVEHLERENRRLRRLWMGTLVSVALLLGLATALVIVAANHGLPGTIADVIEARQYLLRDASGAIRGTWGTSDKGSMRLLLQAPGSKAGLSLAVLDGGASGITVRDTAGRSRAVLGLLPDQTVSLLLADENGTTRTVLSLIPGGASTLVFADRSGSAKAGLGVDSKGQSTMTMSDLPETQASTPEVIESAPSPSQRPTAPPR